MHNNILKIKRAALSVAGFTTVFFGALTIVTPLPTTLIVCSGLAMLSGQYLWARRAIKKIKHEAQILMGLPVKWEHEIAHRLRAWG